MIRVISPKFGKIEWKQSVPMYQIKSLAQNSEKLTEYENQHLIKAGWKVQQPKRFEINKQDEHVDSKSKASNTKYILSQCGNVKMIIQLIHIFLLFRNSYLIFINTFIRIQKCISLELISYVKMPRCQVIVKRSCFAISYLKCFSLTT